MKTAIGVGQRRPTLRIEKATLHFDGRQVWSDLDLVVDPGEFITVLGSNGSGKSSLLRAVLGLQPIGSGSIQVLGRPVRRGNHRVGYIPQQRLFDRGTAMRGRDLVALGRDGHRWGARIAGSARIGAQVDAAVESVGAQAFAGRRLGDLSGGEQQRLRVAQALMTNPALLLCDEPLNSLDLKHQQAISHLIDQRRRDDDTAVLFVTHDINPVLAVTDRVLYLAAGGYRVGTPADVLRSDVLSGLYGTPVEVIRAADRVMVVGAPGPGREVGVR